MEQKRSDIFGGCTDVNSGKVPEIPHNEVGDQGDTVENGFCRHCRKG